MGPRYPRHVLVQKKYPTARPEAADEKDTSIFAAPAKEAHGASFGYGPRAPEQANEDTAGPGTYSPKPPRKTKHRYSIGKFMRIKSTDDKKYIPITWARSSTRVDVDM